MRPPAYDATMARARRAGRLAIQLGYDPDAVLARVREACGTARSSEGLLRLWALADWLHSCGECIDGSRS